MLRTLFGMLFGLVLAGPAVAEPAGDIKVLIGLDPSDSEGLLVNATALGHFTPAAPPGATRVGAREVEDLLRRGVAFVDVRTEKEFKERRAKGVVLVPCTEKSLKDPAFDPAADTFAGIDKLDPTRPVIFACNGAECWKSYKAAKVAVGKGFKSVYWIRGGLPEGVSQGLPVEQGT